MNERIVDALVGNFKEDLPESWCCVDCGMNTAPGCLNRTEAEEVVKVLGEKWHTDEEPITQTITADSELYTVRDAVWKAAGMAPYSGCLCIRCLEKRLGHELRPKDFARENGLNSPWLPGTALRAARLSAGKRRGIT